MSIDTKRHSTAWGLELGKPKKPGDPVHEDDAECVIGARVVVNPEGRWKEQRKFGTGTIRKLGPRSTYDRGLEKMAVVMFDPIKDRIEERVYGVSDNNNDLLYAG